jgi:hypothetical protein
MGVGINVIYVDCGEKGLDDMCKVLIMRGLWAK